MAMKDGFLVENARRYYSALAAVAAR